MLSSQSDNWIPIVHIFDIISLFAAELEEPKIGISGNGLSMLSFISANALKVDQSKIWLCGLELRQTLYMTNTSKRPIH